ncbi:hypothetical protein FQZ97_1162490 [compost metagenome]
MIAKQKMPDMAKPFIERQDGIEALPVAIDDIAERHHEGELFGVEGLDRFGELRQAVGIIAAEDEVRFHGGILRVGDDAEAEERLCVCVHGASP